MANLRIVYDNAADRATLSASASVGTLVAANLLTDTKSEVYRSSTTSATITLTWATAEVVGVVALPFCSLTSSATVRVRGYPTSGSSTPSFDTGAKLAVSSSFGTGNWGTSLGVNSYAYGGGAYAVNWFTPTSVGKIVIDIVDSSNTLGYVEASRVVVGSYWTPTYNADYGVEVSPVDMSKHERSDAGDLRTERGALYKTLRVDLSFMPAADRASLWNLLKTNGLSKPLFFSLSPEVSDSSEESLFQVYGKQSRQTSIRYQFANQFSASLELEEI